jgi:hypothetical protein
VKGNKNHPHCTCEKSSSNSAFGFILKHPVFLQGEGFSFAGQNTGFCSE